MSIDNISSNNIFYRKKIEEYNDLSNNEKSSILSIFDFIDNNEEDNQKGIITTNNAINDFLQKTRNILKEKFDKFLEFIESGNQGYRSQENTLQKPLSRESQYENLANILNITYDKNRGIGKNQMKNILASGYVDANGNVTETSDNIQEAGKYIPSTNDLKNLQYVFGKTQFADNFSDHNQMLDAIEYAKQNGVNIDEATVLISCDTHSDVYFDMPENESIADWVNTALAKNHNLQDFYWVVSDNMVKDKEFGAILSGNEIENEFGGKQGEALVQNIGITANLEEEESVQTYYIYPDGTLTDIEDEGSKPVRIHIVTEKNLPDFSNQKVITTFDMDYFSNSGVDTFTHYRDNKDSNQLNEAFSQMLQTFAEHHIQPIMHGNCYSEDDYLPKEDYNQAQDFANAIIKSTPQKNDILDKYEHKHY